MTRRKIKAFSDGRANCIALTGNYIVNPHFCLKLHSLHAIIERHICAYYLCSYRSQRDRYRVIADFRMTCTFVAVLNKGEISCSQDI